MNVSQSWEELSRFADHSERGWLLLEYADTLSDEDYWRAVADAWQDSDRQGLTRADWRKLWLADRSGRERAMTAEERERLAGFPDRVAVYCGINPFNHFAGLSYTLDRNLAHWFAMRHGPLDYCAVRSGTILRHRILAFLMDRKEQEILAQPKHVYAQAWEKVDPERARQVEDAGRADLELFLQDHGAQRDGDAS